MLHSTFWNHGAGALDLPPWALSMFPMPADLPLKHDNTTPYQSKRRKSKQRETALSAKAVPDGIFLDFLYPPQALAWLQRTSGQQLSRWERRNLMRLPEGFVVTSRGYSSKSYQPSADNEEEIGEHYQQESLTSDAPSREPENRYAILESLEDSSSAVESNDRGEQRQDLNIHSDEADIEQPQSQKQASEDQADFLPEFDFADSPGELAETTPERLQTLRNMIMSTRNKSISPEKSAELSKKAWNIFQSLDESTRADQRLRQELLDWLSLQRDLFAESRCAELYETIPSEQRTMEVYSTMLSLFLRQEDYKSATELHQEALRTLENGHQISRLLFTYAVEQQRWQLAIQTGLEHHATYRDSHQANQIRVFWLHVSEIPRLLRKVKGLATYLNEEAPLRQTDLSTQLFCSVFFKEAMSQQFLRVEEDSGSLTSSKYHLNSQPALDSIKMLVGHIGSTDESATKFFEQLLTAMVKGEARGSFNEYHGVISIVYRQYMSMPEARPSEPMLFDFLQRLTRYEMRLRTSSQTDDSVNMDTIVKDWNGYHGQLSKDAVALLMTYHAKSGDVGQFDRWLEYLRAHYGSYTDHEHLMWTRVYLHARRADLDSAQQAFAEIKREAAEHGDLPDLKCWNVLLHAHARADDLEGAFTNFQNLIEYARLTPDIYSFDPLLAMLSRRGDVEGAEDLIQQYDQIVQDKRTAMMMAHLIEAYVNSKDLPGAEAVLRDTLEQYRKGAIVGSITRCFNVILYAHASRNDIDATMRTYRLMKADGVKVNADSFGALIQVLCYYRQDWCGLQDFDEYNAGAQ